MPIDWSMQSVLTAQSLNMGVANAEIERLAHRNTELIKQAQGDGLVYGMIEEENDKLKAQVANLQAHLYKMEGELRHHKSRDAGLLAEVRALIAAIQSEDIQEQLDLIKSDENGRRAELSRIYEDAYLERWDRPE